MIFWKLLLESAFQTSPSAKQVLKPKNYCYLFIPKVTKPKFLFQLLFLQSFFDISYSCYIFPPFAWESNDPYVYKCRSIQNSPFSQLPQLDLKISMLFVSTTSILFLIKDQSDTKNTKNAFVWNLSNLQYEHKPSLWCHSQWCSSNQAMRTIPLITFYW